MGAFYWPPGTGLVLAGALRLAGSTSPLVGWAVSCLFMAADVALIVLLSAQQLGPRSVRAVAVIALCYPTFLLTAGQTDSHIFSLFWTLLILLCAVRGAKSTNRAWFIFAGVALGMAALTRPALGLLGLLVPLAVFLEKAGRQRRASPGWLRHCTVASMLALAPMLAVLVPVVQHNHARNAGWSISTNNQRNFFLGNNPYTPLYRTWHFASRSLGQLPPEVATYLRSKYAQPHPRAAMLGAALDDIERRPGRFLLRTFNRMCAFWGPDYQGARELQQRLGLHGWRAALLFAIQAGGYWAVALLGLVGTFSPASQADRLVKCLLWSATGVLLFPYALAFSAPVYHFEALGLLMPLAAEGACALALTLRGRGRLRAILSLISARRLMIALIVFLVLQCEFLLLVRG